MKYDSLELETNESKRPETYSELKTELDWFESQFDRANDEACGMTDIAAFLAGNDEDYEAKEEVYGRFEEHRHDLKEENDEQTYRSIERQIKLIETLDERRDQHIRMRRYRDEEPGISGTFWDAGRITATVDMTAYRLTEKTNAIWINDRYYGGSFVHVGHGHFSVSYPRDVDTWIGNNYGEYMTAAEVREYKRKHEQGA